VYKDHAVDFHQLTESDRNAFMADVARVGKAIDAAFSPTKINYGAYSDTLSHLHMHIVPKYAEGYGFGGVFEMNPQKTFLSDEEYSALIEKIKANL
jgi:diadenosine tetraphosphate (Ap4A) HIT family hydrolase